MELRDSGLMCVVLARLIASVAIRSRNSTSLTTVAFWSRLGPPPIVIICVEDCTFFFETLNTDRSEVSKRVPQGIARKWLRTFGTLGRQVTRNPAGTCAVPQKDIKANW